MRNWSLDSCRDYKGIYSTGIVTSSRVSRVTPWLWSPGTRSDVKLRRIKKNFVVNQDCIEFRGRIAHPAASPSTAAPMSGEEESITKEVESTSQLITKTHLVVFVNGLNGNDDNWSVVIANLRKHAAIREVAILASTSNMRLKVGFHRRHIAILCGLLMCSIIEGDGRGLSKV